MGFMGENSYLLFLINFVPVEAVDILLVDVEQLVVLLADAVQCLLLVLYHLGVPQQQVLPLYQLLVLDLYLNLELVDLVLLVLSALFDLIQLPDYPGCLLLEALDG